MPKVVIADAKGRRLADAVDEVFSAFGGIDRLIPAGMPVILKPNGVHYSPQAYTAPAVLSAPACALLSAATSAVLSPATCAEPRTPTSAVVSAAT